MKQINTIIFDGDTWMRLLPLTYTRPTADIRIGILTIRQKWEHYLNCSTSTLSADFLQDKYPYNTATDGNLFINGSVIPNPELVKQIHSLQEQHAIVHDNIVIAVHISGKFPQVLHKTTGELRLMVNELKQIMPNAPYQKVNYLWDIFSLNASCLQSDFELLTKGRKSQAISSSNFVVNPQAIFIEEGASVECASLNASEGPIYIGKNATVMEGSLIRRGLALCNNAILKQGTKIYGATTLGPYVKVGGEINNSVFIGYSNKSHSGYIGNSVIGEWCNLGADTNNSNLKNNYGDVKVWNYMQKDFVNSQLTFCGLFMGDHSKCGINTMFNTGTVVGVSANVFGAGFPPKFIPSFSWGGAEGLSTYQLHKSKETAEKVYARRKKTFEDVDKNLLSTIFTKTKKYRNENA